MDYGVPIAMAVGYSVGVVGGYLLAKQIVRWLSRNCSRPRLVALLGAVGGLAALWPAFLLTIFVGGSFGAGVGDVAGHAFGLESWGVPVGLCLSLAFILVAVAGIGALAGAATARIVALIQPPRRGSDKPIERREP